MHHELEAALQKSLDKQEAWFLVHGPALLESLLPQELRWQLLDERNRRPDSPATRSR